MRNIHLWGVKQNNLKNIDFQIPLGAFVVICGPSGSGKSSLAFDTLYAEGQRRYIESLSNYTKQFLNKAPKPLLEGADHLPPALAIEQKNHIRNSRSNVGTSTEILDYLRIIYGKTGRAFCPVHDLELKKDTISSGVQLILEHFSGEKGYFLVPISAQDRSLSPKELHKTFIKEGYLRIYKPKPEKKSALPATENKSFLAYKSVAMGEIVALDDPSLLKSGLPKKEFYLVIDRIVFDPKQKGRLLDSLSQSFSASLQFNLSRMSGLAIALTTSGKQILLSEELSCGLCDYLFPNISPRLFSFNNSIGACQLCSGFGNLLCVDESRVVPNPQLSLIQGAIKPFEMPSSRRSKLALKNFCEKQKIDCHTPWQELPVKQKAAIWEGQGAYKGVLGYFAHLETKKYKMHVRVFLSRYKSPTLCPSCEGSRLIPEANQVFVAEKNITQLTELTLLELFKHLDELSLTPHDQKICHEPLTQALSRLYYLIEVGLGYLRLDRPTKTLSGGEYQRLALANQLGVELSKTLYVLDEPTVGLHPRDNDRLIKILKRLQNLGNTLVVVEHDLDVIRESDHIVEMGPGSGYLGGEVIYNGSLKEFFNFKQSSTLPYLNANSPWAQPIETRPTNIAKHKFLLTLRNCQGNNLKNVDVSFPLHRLVTITGVSGSGKSTLISQTLFPVLTRALNIDFPEGFSVENIEGLSEIRKVLYIDQKPIGSTTRSNPVTYLKVFDGIRQMFASSPEAKARGYSPGIFSLNVEGGRCTVCKGLGYEVIDMVFMDEIHVPCEACDAKKYRPEVLDIRIKNKNIFEVLQLTVAEAMDYFISHPGIRRPLSLLKEVGLDYIQLGQGARSLSGGESQRLKIAREINSTQQRGTLYILDEPTTGLHFKEVHLLLKVLNHLVDSGGTVILIEHNLEIVRNSDYIIDMGPEAGENGGEIVTQGTPQEVMSCTTGYTGRYLKQYIDSLAKNNVKEVLENNLDI